MSTILNVFMLVNVSLSVPNAMIHAIFSAITALSS